MQTDFLDNNVLDQAISISDGLAERAYEADQVKKLSQETVDDVIKTGSEIIGGKGGGGRPDFAQAGGVEINKIDEAFEKLKALI